MLSKKEKYIRYRKRKAFYESIPYRIFGLFPVNKKKITVCTFEGKGGFCCNPRYIVEELHKRNHDYRFIWLVNDISKKFPDYIRPIKNSLWRRAFHLSTSRVWIDNYRKPYGTRKRKGQYYLQTWHGASAFKTLGLWRGKAFSEIAYLVSKNDSDMIDVCIVDSDWNLEAFPKGLVYEGEFLKYGQARCDILINQQQKQKQKIRERFRLPQDVKLVMYAPTFREAAKDGVRGISVNDTTLDFARMITALENKFGGKWYLCLRLHPQLAAAMKDYPLTGVNEKMIDMSYEDDMCEVMAGVDVFVTDYSSAAMDAGFAYLPVFLYADDIRQYTKDRGGMFWNFPEKGSRPITVNKNITPNIDAVLPFTLARNNKELEKNIENFDEEEYRREIDQIYKDINLINDGKASGRVAELVERWMK